MLELCGSFTSENGVKICAAKEIFGWKGVFRIVKLVNFASVQVDKREIFCFFNLDTDIANHWPTATTLFFATRG